jgi:hypothetical protein
VRAPRAGLWPTACAPAGGGFVQAVRATRPEEAPGGQRKHRLGATLLLLHAHALDAALVRETLNVLLKFEDDIQAVAENLQTLLGRAQAATR